MNPKGGKYIYEDGEWWYVNAFDNNRRRAKAAKEISGTRMWVDGEYIPKSHPLHKPGRYKGFTDAAFSSLESYETSTKGQVYIIFNPAFSGWCKVGMAVDAKDRVKQYQTSSPYRNYELSKFYDVDDRREAESKAHFELEKYYHKRGEWFLCDVEAAIYKLNKLFEGK